MATETRSGKTFQEETDAYAKSSIEDMREELERLEHARECEDSESCDHANDEEWHDEDGARQSIEEGPLSIEIRSGWYSPGGEPPEPEEYNILLGTGGPAARIIGELDGHNQPETARFEYQDWFKPWTAANLSREDAATLLEWAQVFYFGD